ncbi:MAG: hypothetical protein ACOX4L_05700 [Bacillota bacterium]|jgi:hypothetical protein
MNCFDCGNCRQGEAMFYCLSKNDFVIRDKELVVERQKIDRGWKKGAPEYEERRRKIRSE